MKFNIVKERPVIKKINDGFTIDKFRMGVSKTHKFMKKNKEKELYKIV